MTGKGTLADPRRPLYAPGPVLAKSTAAPAVPRSGIIGFSHISRDDGNLALVEFIATYRAALKPTLNDKSVFSSEKGKFTQTVFRLILRLLNSLYHSINVIRSIVPLTESDFSYLSYFVQLVLVYFVSLTTAFVTARHKPDSVTTQISTYLTVWLVAALLSGIIGTALPRHCQEGRLIFLVPASFTLIIVALSTIVGDNDGIVRSFVLEPRPGHGEGSFLTVLLTVPTTGCCIYSVVAFLRYARYKTTGAGSSGNN